MTDGAPGQREIAESWERQLRAHGHRITGQREAILRAVQELPHPTQETILGCVRVSAPELNRTTVYRTLTVLEEVGLLRHSHVGSGSPVYHLSDQAAHIHLVCQSCGAVISVPQEVAGDFVGGLRARTGFEVDVGHTALWGECERCRLGSSGAAEDT